MVQYGQAHVEFTAQTQQDLHLIEAVTDTKTGLIIARYVMPDLTGFVDCVVDDADQLPQLVKSDEIPGLRIV